MVFPHQNVTIERDPAILHKALADGVRQRIMEDAKAKRRREIGIRKIY